jgi:hypothetical protein
MKRICGIALIAFVAAVISFAQQSATPSPAAGPTPVGSGLLHLPPSNEAGAQKAGQLLEQMVAALGGAAYWNMHDMEQDGRTYSFYHGSPTGAGALFWRFWQPPDKERIELTKQRDWWVIYRGDEGFETTFKGTVPVEREQLEDYLRRRDHSLAWVLHKWFEEPGVALFYDGSGIAERKQSERVTVMNSRNDSTTIWIDSDTHLPLRTGFTWRDPKTRYRTEEWEGYDNYRPIQGIMTPFSITRYKDGEPSNQRFINGVKYNQNLPGSMFETKASVVPDKKNH